MFPEKEPEEGDQAVPLLHLITCIKGKCPGVKYVCSVGAHSKLNHKSKKVFTSLRALFIKLIFEFLLVEIFTSFHSTKYKLAFKLN